MQAQSPAPPLRAVTLLVLGSGACALVYQTVWLKLFRQLFGASTAASAAVLAIFMAGLGLGGALLGRRAERSPRPLRFYAHLEIGVAVSAALTPYLLELARSAYYATGGSAVLGTGGAAAIRIGLSVLVLGVPTLLMGGTLPAVARAVSAAGDAGRRSLGLVYGANTVGAVLGALGATFALIEILGLRGALHTAALVNLLVAVGARHVARGLPAAPASEAPGAPDSAPATPAPDATRPQTDAPVPARLVLAAAGVAGFAFLAMELVWYRVLGPLLGGSSYSFGVILAVALLGIGGGGLLYSTGAARRRPTLALLATTFALEAACLLIPYAAGDGVALVAQGLSGLSRFAFVGSVAVWTLIASLVILPAALVSGYQFPLLIALLGQGREGVAAETGRAVLWNTVGAILGSLGAGFGLLTALGALGLWRASAGLLVLSAAALLGVWLRRERHLQGSGVAALAMVAAVAMGFATGPTAYSRHQAIGVGRARLPSSAYDFVVMRNTVARSIVWEEDGVESTVADQVASGHAFIVNGKSDGHARLDACTQVMAGLVPALLQPNPRRALVIGLGTGSTAGWLSQVSTMEQVDVAELEPAILRVAKDCAAVNFDALSQPNVKLFMGDGRELVMTHQGEPWDIIFSEPSNPYRAGIASLFSADFYAAAASRLSDEGVFAQWLQAYEVDAATVETVYATLASVFPYVETWQTCHTDLLLVASRSPIRHDAARVAARLETEPFRTGLDRIWGVAGLEGLYSAYLAGDGFARRLLELRPDAISTDDMARLEFGFAGSVGRGAFQLKEAVAMAHALGADRPPLPEGTLDPARLAEARSARLTAIFDEGRGGAGPTPAAQARSRARAAWAHGELRNARRLWVEGGDRAAGDQPMDQLIVAETAGSAGDEAAMRPAEALLRADGRDAAANFSLALLRAAQRRPDEAVTALEAGFIAARTDPWLFPEMLERALGLASALSTASPALAQRLWRVLAEPFAVGLEEDHRLGRRMEVGANLDFEATCVDALAPMEPWVPFYPALLRDRVRCYEAHAHPLLSEARHDLDLLIRLGTRDFGGAAL